MSAPNDIQAVLLDFGGVILHIGDPEPHRRLARRLGIPMRELWYEIYEGPLSVAAQRGEITPQELWRGLAQKWGWPPERGPELARIFWQGIRIETRWADWLRGLRPRYRTGLLSNAWGDLRETIQRLGMADAFDALIVSAEEGLLKPDPAIYRLALRRLGVAPEQAVFVDDREENIAAARALGMHGVRFASFAQAMAELHTLGLP